MAKEKICGIYCIENLINQNKYIGQSNDIYTRWKEHKFELNKNTHHNRYLQNAWNKYGKENFKFYIVEICEKSILDEREIYYIKYFDTYAYLGNKNGYNLTIGGEGIGELSEEERQVFREAQKSIPIYQIDMKGNIVKLWEHGARHASKELNIGQAPIWHCVNGDRKTYKNYIWITTDDFEKFNINDYINQNTQSRKIKQYSMDGDLVRIWESGNQVQTELGYDCSCILKVCKRKYKSYKNYIWCYEYDDYVDDNFLKELHSKDYVNVYDLEWNLLDRLTSQVEVAKKYELSKAQVSQCLKGEVSRVKSYRLKYSA